MLRYIPQEEEEACLEDLWQWALSRYEDKSRAWRAYVRHPCEIIVIQAHKGNPANEMLWFENLHCKFPAKMTPVLQVCAAASGHIGIVPKTYQNFGSLREYQMPIPSYNDEYFDDDEDV